MIVRNFRVGKGAVVSADGETEMPEDFRYWHGLFRRARKLEDGGSVAVKTDLDELKKHIVSCKGAGKRGLPILKIVAEIPRKNARRKQRATNR